MVEIIEYALAFAVSSGLAASGLVLLQGYYPLVGQMTLRSEFSQIADSAEVALVTNSSRSLVVDLNSLSLSCEGSVISLSSGATTYSAVLNGSCDFSYPQLVAKHTLTFIPNNGVLRISVDT